jgi:hypothetical protein
MEKTAMSNTASKLVTNARLRQLLDCYGSESSSWPEDERQAALSLLKGSPELKQYRDDVRELDRLLTQLKSQENQTVDQKAVHSLQQRIIQELPAQASNPGNESVQDTNRSSFWMGSIAASLFIVGLSAGVIHQLTNSGQNNANSQTGNYQTSNEFDQWAWEDVTGETLVIDTDNDPTTLLALVELELPVE